MELHQVIVSASPGDAVTNQALELRTLLRRIGPSEIYARFLDPALANDILPLTSYVDAPSSRHDRILIYHASIGQADVVSFLLERNDPLVLVYHNITPAQFFLPYDVGFARLLSEGRAELSLLRDRVTLPLAVSRYNALELETIGYRDVQVSPPIVDVEALRGAQPHDATAQHLDQEDRWPLLLFVGQLLPHKRPDLLLQAYYVLVTYLIPEARLAVIGSPRLPGYERALRSFLQETNLPNAWLCGGVSQPELIAYFQRADLFVTASEHEGFCIPLVEAMAFEKPIVARDFAAIPETMDGAGVLLPADAGPIMLAEAMAEVIEDRTLAGDLARRSGERAERFDADTARRTFLEHLAAAI